MRFSFRVAVALALSGRATTAAMAAPFTSRARRERAEGVLGAAGMLLSLAENESGRAEVDCRIGPGTR
jgi:hypothetical protein